jgi:hypothetical protein
MRWAGGVLAIAALCGYMIHAFVVTGPTGGGNDRTGSRPFRQDLVKMQRQGGPVWDLYLQALRRFQDLEQSEALSWFQFNGMHMLSLFKHSAFGINEADGKA